MNKITDEILKVAVDEYEYYLKNKKFKLGANAFYEISVYLTDKYSHTFTKKEVAYEVYRECAKRWANGQ